MKNLKKKLKIFKTMDKKLIDNYLVKVKKYYLINFFSLILTAFSIFKIQEKIINFQVNTSFKEVVSVIDNNVASNTNSMNLFILVVAIILTIPYILTNKIYLSFITSGSFALTLPLYALALVEEKISFILIITIYLFFFGSQLILLDGLKKILKKFINEINLK